jgi:hypothetical protein
MQSSRKRAVGLTSSGLAVSWAGVLLRLALGLLVAVASVLWLPLVPSGVVRAQRASGNADLAPQAASPAGAGRSAMVSRQAPAAEGRASLGEGSMASTGTVIVSLNPSSASVAKDQIFTVDIQIVAGAQQVDAAEIFLSFSQTYLQVVDADPVKDGVQIEDLSGWDSPLANAVYTDTEPAQIHFAAGIFGSGTKPSGTFSLARISFKALKGTAGGSTPLFFGTVLPYQTKVYYGVTWVLGGVENGSVTISGGTPTVTPTPLMRTVFLPVVIRQR